MLNPKRDPVTRRPKGVPWKKLLAALWLVFLLGTFLFFFVRNCATAG